MRKGRDLSAAGRERLREQSQPKRTSRREAAVKVCIPTETGEGLKARVYGHFGSAPYFTLVDSEGKSVEVIDNGNQRHAHGECHPVASLQGHEVEAVVTGGMGVRAVQMFHDAGIKVFRAQTGTVGDTLREIAAGRLEEITVDDACRHHGGCH
jgi:predicted Fe-Mo cluster-binding NifX family protein